MVGAWLGFDSLFWLTVLVIFLATILGAVLGRLRKDKCLKLLHDHHVTYLTGEGAPLWGDLLVASQGLELRYDAPYLTPRGLAKASYLVFPDEWENCLALGRTIHGLTPEERDRRDRQIGNTFDPPRLRRMLRAVRNLVNTIRDAVTKSLTLFVGAMASRGAMGKAVGGRKGEVDDLGESLVGFVGNAYEPLLERHIGRPVILQLAAPGGPCEFPGYLVDYSERFVAVFNVEQRPEAVIDLETTATETREGLAVELEPGRVVLSCTGPDAIVVNRLEQGGRGADLGVVLLPGCALSLPRIAELPIKVSAVRTRRIDLVCPRGRARIRFGSDETQSHRPNWTGVAPPEESAVETQADK